MKDRFGRRVEYLRISVTDRCNLRCTYCIPAEGLPWLPRWELLSYEEISRLVGVFVQRGVRKVRVTGGEPTVRADLLTLIRKIGSRSKIDDLALSTNGLHMRRLAGPFAAAGLRRVNVSVDSLRPERFREITRGGDLERVLDGLVACEEAGLAPVKLNVVAQRGVNDDEVEDFALLTRRHPWHVRFIEMMPLTGNVGDQERQFLSAAEILRRIREVEAIEPAPAPRASGPATHYRFPGAPGTIGVISPLSETFCESCNRVRLTADGRLRLCLFGDGDIDLRGPLREGATDREILEIIDEGLAVKPERHGLDLAKPASRLVALSQIGG
jgi:cyclic pyranopterin phosphate synthase